jgi:hypothetical protein
MGNCRKASMNSAKKEGLRNSLVLARKQSAIFSGFTQASELVDEDPSCLHPAHKESRCVLHGCADQVFQLDGKPQLGSGTGNLVSRSPYTQDPGAP